MNIRYFFGFLIILSIFTHCSTPEATNIPDTNTKPFFDLKGFIEAQIKEHYLKEDLGDFYPYYKELQKLQHISNGTQARMPYDINIK